MYRSETSDLRGPFVWQIEFENIYKIYQFLESITQPLSMNLQHTMRDGSSQLRVYVVTYNMARESLDLKFSKLIPGHEQYGVIVWGAQECPRSGKEDQIQLLTEHLKFSHVQIASVHMWEMFLVVFIHKNSLPQLKPQSIRTNYITLGVLNLIGNKGALLVQFTLHDRLWSFINCHLSCGPGKGDQRSDMMGTALKEIGVHKECDQVDQDCQADFSFILGDLNYRLKSTYSQHIRQVEGSCNMLETLDELWEAQNLKGRFPGY